MPQFLCLLGHPPSHPTSLLPKQKGDEKDGKRHLWKEKKERKRRERLLATPCSSHTASPDITSLNTGSRLHPCSHKPDFLLKTRRTLACKPVAFPKSLINGEIKYRKGSKTKATKGFINHYGLMHAGGEPADSITGSPAALQQLQALPKRSKTIIIIILKVFNLRLYPGKKARQ